MQASGACSTAYRSNRPEHWAIAAILFCWIRMKVVQQLTCLTLGHPNGLAYSTGELLNTPRTTGQTTRHSENTAASAVHSSWRHKMTICNFKPASHCISSSDQIHSCLCTCESWHLNCQFRWVGTQFVTHRSRWSWYPEISDQWQQTTALLYNINSRLYDTNIHKKLSCCRDCAMLRVTWLFCWVTQCHSKWHLWVGVCISISL